MTALVVISLCSCDSKAEKTVNELKGLEEQYARDIDNAKTKQEAIEITNEHKKRVKFEVNKLSDEEIKEYNKNLSWDEAKQLEQLKKESDNAIERAKERFRNQQ